MTCACISMLHYIISKTLYPEGMLYCMRFPYHSRKKNPPVMHRAAPSSNAQASPRSARLPKAILVPIPTLSMITAWMLRAVAGQEL